MCGSMVDIQCPTSEIRRGNKKRRRKKKPQYENICPHPAMQGGHKQVESKVLISTLQKVDTTEIDLSRDT